MLTLNSKIYKVLKMLYKEMEKIQREDKLLLTQLDKNNNKEDNSIIEEIVDNKMKIKSEMK